MYMKLGNYEFVGFRRFYFRFFS